MVLHTDCKSVDLGFDPLLTLMVPFSKRDSIEGHSSVVRIVNFKFTNACSIRAGLDKVNYTKRNVVSMVACRSPKSRGPCSSQGIPVVYPNMLISVY